MGRKWNKKKKCDHDPLTDDELNKKTMVKT